MRTGPAALAAALAVATAGSAALAQQDDDGGAAARQSWEVAAAAEPRAGGWEAAKQSALLGLERLRAEIQVLEALSALQDRLLEWNQVRLESGMGPASLEESLCEAAEVRVWCALLPATFGRGGGDEDERG